MASVSKVYAMENRKEGRKEEARKTKQTKNYAELFDSRPQSSFFFLAFFFVIFHVSFVVIVGWKVLFGFLVEKLWEYETSRAT